MLAGGDDLVLAAALRPDVAREYLAVERAKVALGAAAAAAAAASGAEPHAVRKAMTGRTFQQNRGMAQIIEAARIHPIVNELNLWVP